MALSPGISVVVPVYNSAETLGKLVARLETVLGAIPRTYEIVLVNDASQDASWPRIVEIAREDPLVRGLTLTRNCGQHNALLAGIRAARFDTIVTLDDDLQNPPEEIPRLLETFEQGCDVVYGRRETEEHGLWRDLSSVLTKQALASAMGAEAARHVSPFRIFRTVLRDAFADYRSPYVSIDVLLSWATKNFTGIAVRHEPRLEGRSNYTFAKLVHHAFNMMTGFSTLPLRLASLLGFAFTLFGGLVLAVVLVRWLISGSVVPGFAFLASSIAVFSGVQLFTLGIVGEYIARIYVRSQGQPSYMVRETTFPHDTQDQQ